MIKSTFAFFYVDQMAKGEVGRGTLKLEWVVVIALIFSLDLMGEGENG